MTFFVNSAQTDSAQITIAGDAYAVDELFAMAEERTVQAETGETGTGAALDQIMRSVEIIDPESRQYTLMGADGYQKTVKWENLENGILSLKRSSVFSDLPKAFYVKEIVEIKVD